MLQKGKITKALLLFPVATSGLAGLAALVLTIAAVVPGQGMSSSAYLTPMNPECDVWPRETGGDGVVTKEDWQLISQFSVGALQPTPGLEFQKADCAPRSAGGDGKINVSDLVQAGRYVRGLDVLVPASGPTGPVRVSLEGDVWPQETGGDGKITKEDYDLAGEFSVGAKIPSIGLEFQKADTAPKSTSGDGKITVSDWVQTGRYWQGLDASQPAGGPKAPVQ